MVYPTLSLGRLVDPEQLHDSTVFISCSFIGTFFMKVARLYDKLKLYYIRKRIIFFYNLIYVCRYVNSTSHQIQNVRITFGICADGRPKLMFSTVTSQQ